MRATTYAADLIETVKRALDQAKPMPRTHLLHKEAMESLAPQVRGLFLHKRYTPQGIVELLRSHGIKATQKEVKQLLPLTRRGTGARAKPGLA